MDPLTLILITALVIVTIFLIVHPLWQRTQSNSVTEVDPLNQELANAEVRYQVALASVKELIFDHEMGKIDEADYQPLLAKAKLDAAKIRQRIDSLQQEIPLDATIDAEIEQQVAEVRHTPLEPDGLLLAEIDAEINQLQTEIKAEVKRMTQQKNTQAISDHKSRCPECGYTTQPDDQFCAQCGTSLITPIRSEAVGSP